MTKTPWTEEEKQYLIDNWKTMHPKDMGRHLNRTEAVISAKCYYMGLKQTNEWTKEQDEFLINNHGELGNKEIAKHLGMKTKLVACRANQLGLQGKNLKVGDEHGKFTVLETWIGPYNGINCKFVAVECNCGSGIIKRLRQIAVLRGEPKSCGCLALLNNKAGDINRRHGKTRSSIHNAWVRMRQRCNNPKNQDFNNYGGRGIKVCGEWNESFEAFYEWAMSSGYKEGLTIERIDVNGNYEPNNCCWIPKSEQADNTRKTVYLTAFGETKSSKKWSKDPRCAGVPQKELNRRVRQRGWDHEKAITTPMQYHNKKAPI